MTIRSLLAAPLSDGRIQLFATKDNGKLFTLWKEGDANSPWSQWTPFLPEANGLGVALGAAAPLPNRALQLFVKSNAGGAGPVVAGPNVDTIWKVSGDSAAAWSGWRGFWAPGGFNDPGRVVSIAAAPLREGGAIQVFMVSYSDGAGHRLFTTWKQSEDVNAAWGPVAEFNPRPPQPLRTISTIRLFDGRIQLIGASDNELLTCWKQDDNPNAGWGGWVPFMPRKPVSDDVIISASLSDGRPQLWSLDRFGSLKTCFKVGTNANAAWSDWTAFQAPPPNEVAAFTAAPLSDRRLQLWAADRAGGLWTTWKVGGDANSAWQAWSAFPRP